MTIDASALSSGFTINVASTENSRAFRIDDGNAAHEIGVVLRGLVVQGNGKVDFHNNEGGIISHEQLTIEDSRFLDLEANVGAGIFATGSTMIRDSDLLGNTSYGLRAGGAILSMGELSIKSSTIANNRNEYYSDSDFGHGGSAVSGGIVNIFGSSLYGNSIRWDSNRTTVIRADRVVLEQSTIDDLDVHANVEEMRSSTVTSGVLVDEEIVAGNSVVGILGGFVRGLKFEIQNSVVLGQAFREPLLSTTVPEQTDAFGNIVGPEHGPIDVLLGPLANNGGRTLTRIPLPDSPLLDAGAIEIIGQEVARDVDQRGNYPRIEGSGIDIGAVERGMDGDANGDGLVDETDFTILMQNYGSSKQGWFDGNFDGSGDGVGFKDFLLLARNYSQTP